MDPVPQIIYNAPPPIWTVASALGAAIIAGGIALTGWVVVHRTSKSRDLENWRRTTLATAVTTMMSVGEEAVQLGVDVDNRDQMKALYAKFASLDQQKALVQMCDPYRMWEWANSYTHATKRLINMHSNGPSRGSDWHEEFKIVEKQYQYARSGMTDSLARSVGLKEPLPLNLDIAYVILRIPRTKWEIRRHKISRAFYDFAHPTKYKEPWSKDKDEFKDFKY